MSKKLNLVLGIAAATGLLVLGVGQSLVEKSAIAAEGSDRMAPAFEVDPFWPKPLPNHWVMGRAIGVATDSRDHVYVVHRDQNSMFGERTEIGLKTGVSECCTPAPPILEFDPAGNLVNAWGGPGEGYTWPGSNHGIEIAPNGDVWIGGNGPTDSHVLVFSRDGKFIKEIGKPGQKADSNSKEHFSMVAEIAMDVKANEAYIADGYGNKRVAVVDMTSGEFKRYWGAYGNAPEDVRIRYNPDDAALPQQFIGPVHCAEPSNDGLVYVCDRGANRVQVFKLDGTFVKEQQFAPKTLSQGAVWDLTFSRDAEQKYMYIADGQNMKVYVVERQSLELLYSFGDGGRQPGLFYAVHSIVSDTKGNIFTTETYEGKRVQKFIYKGLKKLPAEKNVGAPWPKC